MKSLLTRRSALLLGALVGVAVALRVCVAVDRPAPASTSASASTSAAPPADAPHPVVPRTPPQLPTLADAAPVSPHDERIALVARIRDNMTGHEPWNARGLVLLDLAGQRATATTDRGCYMAGCVATFTFPSRQAYDWALADLEKTPEYVSWTGAKQLTAPEVANNGAITIAIALLRPD